MGEDDDHPNNPKRQKTEGYDDLFKIEDFSERITTVKGGNTGIFWDVEDYPFPVSYSPDEIYEKFKTALHDIGGWSGDMMSIWAYVDEKKGSRWCQFLGTNKTWKSRIYFISGGDKPARLTRMFHDITLWTMDAPMDYPKPSCLFIFSEKFNSRRQFLSWLQHLHLLRHYTVILFCPPSEDLPPENSGWPKNLLYQDCCDLDGTIKMDEPSASDHGSEDKKG